MRISILLITSIVVALTFVISSPLTYADVINVPDDFETIQAAIDNDNTENGDTVLVAPGEYVENINFSGKNIVVMGNPDDPGEVIIDGGENGSVVTFNNEETESAVLTGFTIRNGSGQYSDIVEENTGGGIMVDHTSPTFRNLAVCNNTVPNQQSYSIGGGIAIYSSNSIFEQIDVWGNTAGVGGGIYTSHTSSPIFIDVEIHNNQAIIQENQWGSSGSGGGIICQSNASFERCVVYENTGERFGGGLWFQGDYNPQIINLTITGNSSPQGAGIYIQSGVDVTLINTICWSNDGNEIYFRNDEPRSSISVRYSDIEGGQGGIVTNDNGDVTWGEGTIDSDPLFLDTENGDFSLTENSPCVDAGTAFFVWEEDTLINMTEDEYEGFAPDMGAFESPYENSVDGSEYTPHIFALYPNFPNPFNKSTSITYSLPHPDNISLQVYNLSGQQITTLYEGYRQPGTHTAILNATNLPSGLYFIRLKASDQVFTQKVMLIR